jgi:hypothetical protein
MSCTTRAARSQAVRNIVLAVGVLAALVGIYPGSCNAQSADKNHPTPVTGKEISGRADYPIPNSGWGKTFYYIFDAGPGEMNVTVMSWSDNLTSRASGGWFEKRSNKGGGTRYSLTLNEYTTNHEHGTTRRTARPFPAIGLIAPLENGKREVSKKFILPEQTRLIMAVNLSGRFNYRITFDGPIVSANPDDGSQIEDTGCLKGSIRDSGCVLDCGNRDRSSYQQCVNQCPCVRRIPN